MSDDLVKRLREGDEFEQSMMAERAADSIEELELEVETWKSRAIHQNEVAGRLEAKLSESEALLAKAVEALEEGMRCTSEHGGAAKFLRIARTTLAELSSVSCANLKGESDE
jgi:hypothetical protein